LKAPAHPRCSQEQNAATYPPQPAFWIVIHHLFDLLLQYFRIFAYLCKYGNSNCRNVINHLSGIPSMKHIQRLALASIAAITTVAQGFCVPAKRGLHTISQPDGTCLQVRIIGDEWSHTYLTADGHPLVTDANGAYRYASIDNGGNPMASPMLAANPADRTPQAQKWLDATNPAEILRAASAKNQATRAQRTAMRQSSNRSKWLFSEAKFPSKGKQKALVILVEYRDVKFTIADPHDYFNRMLNEPGFADYGGTGSARDYFLHCSTGQFDPEFTLLGPVTLTNDMSFYGGNKANGDDRNPHRMAIEACQQLDAVVDFSEYDRDGDGFIDNVFIFYAGRGEASGGGANTVWPHTWYVTSAEATPYVFDGVTLDRYACSNEWENGSPDGVGTFCHEFSHVLGLPDLYASDYTAAFTPGNWAVMDHGSYNNDGRTPPAYSSFERYALGWIAPRQLTGAANLTLRDISSNTACIIKTPDDNEFYLFENRAQTGWDTYLPGHGMLAWHIHYDSTEWLMNSANNDPNHQHIDLIEADNIQSDETRDGDAFPGTANVTSFADDTTPAMSTWCGATLNLPLTEITEQGNLITFKVAGGVPKLPNVTMLPPTEITPGGFTANWEAVEGAEAYELTLYSTRIAENGRPINTYVEGYTPRNVGNVTSYAIDGLTPSTAYRLSVAAVAADSTGDPSSEIAVTTAEATFEYLSPVANDATEITASSFTASWQPMADATTYLLDVYQYTPGEPETAIADFTGGLSAFTSAGWSTDSKATLANEAYAGTAIPSLRLSTDGSYIDTPLFPSPARSIEFWHRGISASANNSLTIKALVNDTWVDVESIPVTNDAGGSITTLESLPAGTSAIRIAYSMQKGSVAIDDIKACYGGEKTELPVNGYNPLNAGNDVSATVSGLTPDNEYFYRVTAVNAEGEHSRRSDEIALKTHTASGVEATIAAAKTWQLHDRVLTLHTSGSYHVYDITGRTVATGEANGAASIKLPTNGIYIVRTTDETLKIAVR